MAEADSPNFDGPLKNFLAALLVAGFTDEQAITAAGRLGTFTAEAFMIMQQDVHQTVDRLGLEASDRFADEIEHDDWYRGFLSGVIVASQVVLFGSDYARYTFETGLIPLLRRGMDVMLDKEEVPPEMTELVETMKAGRTPTADLIEAALKAWEKLV